jgi:hypothetical protein
MDTFIRRQWQQGCASAAILVICLSFVFSQSGCSKEKLEEMATAVKD